MEARESESYEKDAKLMKELDRSLFGKPVTVGDFLGRCLDKMCPSLEAMKEWDRRIRELVDGDMLAGSDRTNAGEDGDVIVSKAKSRGAGGIGSKATCKPSNLGDASKPNFPPLYVRYWRTGLYPRGTDGAIPRSSRVMRFADNAPAWFVMTRAFGGGTISAAAWAKTQHNLPCSFHEAVKVLKGDCPNLQGWYVAHIYGLNNRTKPPQWDEAEVNRRCLKFLHPLNMFPFPCPTWATRDTKQYMRRLAEHPDVLRWVFCYYLDRYGDLYREFTQRINEQPLANCAGRPQPLAMPLEPPDDSLGAGFPSVASATSAAPAGVRSQAIGMEDSIEEEERLDQRAATVPTDSAQVAGLLSLMGIPRISAKPAHGFLPDGRQVAVWKATRLHFKRAPIDKLQSPDDLIIIRIEPTPKSVARGYKKGWFVMTKGEFNRILIGIQKTKSWADPVKGEYHYPSPPHYLGPFFMQ